MYLLFSSVFPEKKWLPWKFNCAMNFWEDKNNQKNFIQEAEKELKIEKMEDWYKISNKVTKKMCVFL